MGSDSVMLPLRGGRIQFMYAPDGRGDMIPGNKRKQKSIKLSSANQTYLVYDCLVNQNDRGIGENYVGAHPQEKKGFRKIS